MSAEAAVRLGAPHCARCRRVDCELVAVVSGYKSTDEIDDVKNNGYQESFCSARCAITALRFEYVAGTATALVHDAVNGNVLALKSEKKKFPRITPRGHAMLGIRTADDDLTETHACETRRTR